MIDVSGEFASSGHRPCRVSRPGHGSNLGSSSLLPLPRLGTLPAVPRRPVRALARLRAVVRAWATGRAPGAPLQVPFHSRRRRGQTAGGRHPARVAAHQAEHRQSLRKVLAAGVGASARDVERGGPRVDPRDDVPG
jgi:hypothetical protein